MAQKILSYTLVVQKENPAHKYDEIFYDRDLAKWLLDHYIEFIEHYQDRPNNRTRESDQVENVLPRIKDVLNDLGELDLIKFESAEQRRGTSDIITVYRPTFAGHLIALLIEVMESEKHSQISLLKYTICLTHILKNTIHLMMNSMQHYLKNIWIEDYLTNLELIF